MGGNPIFSWVGPGCQWEGWVHADRWGWGVDLMRFFFWDQAVSGVINMVVVVWAVLGFGLGHCCFVGLQ